MCLRSRFGSKGAEGFVSSAPRLTDWFSLGAWRGNRSLHCPTVSDPPDGNAEKAHRVEQEIQHEWWRDLGRVTLSPELNAKLVSGVDDELAGIDPAELVARRDAVLTTLLAAKAQTGL